MAGIGFDQAAHYQAYPGSFVGRQIAFYHMRFADLKAGSIVDWAKVRQAIEIVQTNMEVMFVSVPYVSNGYGALQFMVSYDTANPDPQNGDSIEQRLQDLFEDGGIVFRREFLVGSNFYSQDDFLDYVIDNSYFPDNKVFAGGVEQDELDVLIANYI